MGHPHKGGAGFSRFSTARKNKGLEMHTLLDEQSDAHSDEQPVSSRSFHRQIAASIMQHHRDVERARRSMQPVSPASYSSSMELTPYNPAASASPTSSVDYKGAGDSAFGLKTSTELLKVLNRIWCLEEQHALNRSLVTGLKMELDNARMRIKELLREKQMDMQVIDDLMNQISQQDRMQSALKSMREELEKERKLRKRSEGLHRKLAREISEVKASFSEALNGLERERKAQILLEELCDEFALGIREYEQELRSLKHRTDIERVQKDCLDSLVVHMSEAWLDERMQMKLAEKMGKNVGEKGMIVDELRPEIESFLRARRQTSDSKGNINMPMKISAGGGLHQQCSESFHLNEPMTAPPHADDEEDDDSIDSDTNCFELNNNLGGEFLNGIHMENVGDSKETSFEDHKGKLDVQNKGGQTKEASNGGSLSSLQGRLEKHMARTQWPPESKMNHILDDVLRTNPSSTDGEKIHPQSELADAVLGDSSSSVKKWEQTITSKDSGNPESSSRWSRGSKENTLKDKLLEARLEGRNYRSRCS